MLELAHERAAGAYPYLVSTAYVRQAKGVLGPDRALAVLVAFEPDLVGAREMMGRRSNRSPAVPHTGRTFRAWGQPRRTGGYRSRLGHRW